MTPLFSIIIATWNSAATIERTLASLRAQDGADFEVLLADGASSDETMAIVERYGDIVRHRLSEPDKGVYDAWNKLIPHAKGEWLMFLGSDDWLEKPDVLKALAAEVAAIPEPARPLSFVYGRTNLVANGKVIEILGQQPLPKDRLESDEDMGFSHTGLLHHRSLFERFGLFDAAFASAGDYEFIHRASVYPDTRIYAIPITVAQMASGGMSNSPNGRVTHYREMVAARRKLHLEPAPKWLTRALLRAQALKFIYSVFGANIALMVANLYRIANGKASRGDIG